MKGKFQTLVASCKCITVATIYVTEQDGGCLIGNTTTQELRLISFHLNKIGTSTNFRKQDNTSTTNPVKDKTIQNLLNKHNQYLKELGNSKTGKLNLLWTKASNQSYGNNEEFPSIYEL